MQENMMMNGGAGVDYNNNNMGVGGGGDGSAAFPDLLLLPPPWAFHQAAFNPTREPDPFLAPSLFRQFGGGYDPADHIRLLDHSAAPFGGLHAELQKMTAQEMMDAKALAASKSHSEAERRRRERINNHLARLRSLLPSTTKTDKASLLAEVIEHVKELKRQTTLIAETSPVPTETDELTIENESDGKLIRASICCDDRPDLMPDLIRTLKDLRLKTLKAEITTLGGRVKNVLFITTGDHDETNGHEFCVSSIEDALRAVMEKSSNRDQDQSAATGVKRQRTYNEHHHHHVNSSRSL